MDGAREALMFAEGRTIEDLKSNRMLALSLVKELEIIGEAASNVSTQVRSLAPEIPWPLIVGMRNRLIHAYFEINIEIVWVTVTNSLPQLIGQIERLVEAPEASG